MTNGAKWVVGIGVSWIVAFGLAGCSGSSGGGDEAAAGAGPGTGDIPPETQEVRSELPRDTTPDVTEADYESFVASTNEFGLDVFAELTTGDTNVVFSPLSVAVALGMTYAGARNDTASQMSTVLHNALSDEAFHAANNRLALHLASRNIAPHGEDGEEKSLRLRLVNAIWAQTGYALEQPFLDVLATNYDAGVKLADFVSAPEASRQTINDWVAYQTEDRIQDLVGPGAISSNTLMVLTNALYFYGSWTWVFRPESTNDGAFHTLTGGDVTAEMMYQSFSHAYAAGDGYQLLDLPYDGDELAMTILLPEAGRFDQIRAQLSGDWLEQARGSLASTRVNLTLPKFRFAWGTKSLADPLIALGMSDAFQAGAADFTGIHSVPELYIADVLHQAFIGVDESGTEAAAATAVILDRSAVDPAEVVAFTVDRPFIFFIRDSSGVLLFSGQVMDPTAH